MGKVADPLKALDDQVESTLWGRYTGERDMAARDALIELHLPFVRILAAKLYAGRQIPQIEFEEFFQHGVVGMLEAIDRYDPARGVKFRAFAALRIEGAILNGIENHNEQQEQIALRTRLRKQERLVMLKEAAKDPGEAKSMFSQLADIAVGMALGYMLDESGMYASESRGVEDQAYADVELKQLKSIVIDLVDGLADQEKQVIKSYYFWEMGVEEIGALMGVTKGRVSQIHRQALETLLKRYRKNNRLDIKL